MRLYLVVWKLEIYIPYFLDWNARVLLVSSVLLAGVVFEGAFYSRARSIPFSLSVTKFFSKHKKLWTISLHNHTILIHHNKIILFSTLMSDSFTTKTVAAPQTLVKIVSNEMVRVVNEGAFN